MTRRFDRCPDCGRDLQDLPPPAVCPDCGLEYDEHSRVWRSRKSWHHHAFTYGMVGLAIGVVLAVVYRLVRGEVPHPAFPLLFALIYAVGGMLMRSALTGRLSGRFVAVTPKGVVIGTRRRSRLIPWSEVERASERKGVPRIDVRGSGVPIALEDVFDRPADVAEFRDEVKRARRRYREPPHEP